MPPLLFVVGGVVAVCFGQDKVKAAASAWLTLYADLTA
jgi:hypothetical protein